MDKILNKQQIRAVVRQQRQSLSAEFQIQAAEQCADIIVNSNLLENKKNIAFYISNDNELNLQPLIEHCLSNSINCYLPILNQQHLDFVIYNEHSEFTHNKYKIPEPVAKYDSDYISPEELDLVFLPLVAFNKNGQRLGMGGGFYDRTFAFLQNSVNNKNKPILIGIAYNLQCINSMPNDPWDIKIHGVATENEFIKF